MSVSETELQKALEISYGERKSTGWEEELNAFFALTSAGLWRGVYNGVDHHSSISMYAAAGQIIERQQYSAQFHQEVAKIDERLSGQVDTEAQPSPLLRTIASWKTLGKKERIGVCQLFADYMTHLLNAQFDPEKKLKFSIVLASSNPSLVFNSSALRKELTVFTAGSYANTENDYEKHGYNLCINTHPRSTFQDGVKTLGHIYRVGLETLQEHLAQVCMYNREKVPEKYSAIGEDIRLLGRFFEMPENVITRIGADKFVMARFARQHADGMEKMIGDLLETHKDFIKPMETKRGIIARVLGL